MRRYILVLVIMAVLIGSLFRASEQTGVRLMNMFATLGIFLFGVVGTLALTRWQSRAGLKAVEEAVKSLEPDWVITDWAFKGGGRPDYLLVGPGGLVAVRLADTAQSVWRSRARAAVARARQQAVSAGRWVQERLEGTEENSLPVESVLVLTRRRSEPEYSGEGVTVLNANELVRYVSALWNVQQLDERARFQVTRKLRSA